ncbi:nucleic acid-binding protein [Xylaria nigripes]|nr:nucleic acid-binding protein [Xylaria nigripes]
MSFLARRLTAPLAGASRAFSTTARRDLAKITVVGNLAASPELRTTNAGQELIEYTVASNSGPRDKRHTSWFRITTFVEEGPRKEYLLNLQKGSTVYVEGEAINRIFTDKDGKTKTAMSIYQQHLEVLRRTQPTESTGTTE